MKPQSLSNPPQPEISHGIGSLLHTTDGRQLIDLVCGFGTVFLGHAQPEIVAAVQQQAGRIWSCGRYPTLVQAEAEALIASILPTGLQFGGMYSTGMEAAEFAMRLAASHTGRREFVGFARSMHGKSSMAAALCWDNALVGSDRAHVLPFVADASEAEILERLTARLQPGRIAAVLVEPLQGSNGGFEASADFYRQLIALCRQHDTLCIFDEVLTGLYRTGARFHCEALGVQPDIVIFAKSMANGFPASAVAIRSDITIAPLALPGSTFAGNPLAAAATAATLRVMQALPLPDMLGQIDRIVRDAFAACQNAGIVLRGRGALWAIELGAQVPMGALTQEILARGVLVSSYGRYIRLLPAATIPPGMLQDACQRIAGACLQALEHGERK